MSESEAIAVGVIVIVVAAIFTSWSLAWRSRRRRDAALRPEPLLGDIGELRAAFSVLVLATTRSDDALERVAVDGLAVRSSAVLQVHEDGLVFRLAGAHPDVVIGRSALRGVGRANWVLDRGSGGDRIVFVRWWAGLADDGAEVDTALRHHEPGAVVAAISALLPADALPRDFA